MRLGLWDLLRSFFSHRAHRVHGAFWRTVSSPQKASGIQSSQSVTAKDGCKVLWYLPAVRPLWNAVCSVLLCFSVRKRTHPLCEKERLRFAGEFFLSQSAQSSLSILAHVSSPQNASGIQRTQSVSAIVDTDKEAKSSLHPPHMGISVITPLPFGGGAGGGAAIFLPPVCSVHLCSSVRERRVLRER